MNVLIQTKYITESDLGWHTLSTLICGVIHSE